MQVRQVQDHSRPGISYFISHTMGEHGRAPSRRTMRSHFCISYVEGDFEGERQVTRRDNKRL